MVKGRNKQTDMIKKSNEKEIREEREKITPQAKSQKEFFLELYKTLKDFNIRSISDLENLIAKES